MANKKVRFEYPVESISYSRKQKDLPDDGEQIVLVKRKNGTTYLSRRRVKPYEQRKSNNATVVANNEKFKAVTAEVKMIMADDKLVEKYRQAWYNSGSSGNKKYSTLRGYIFSEVYKTK